MNKKLIIIFGVLCSSVSSVFVRLADAPSSVLAFYRMFISAVIMMLPAMLKNRQELFSLSRKNLCLSILSGIFLGLHFTVFFLSLSYTSIATATTLSCMEVFFVAFALVFYFKERIPAQAWMGIIIAFIGSVLIALSDLGSGRDMLKGDLLALAACFLASSYTVLGKVVRKNMTTCTYTFVVYFAAAVTIACLCAFTGTPLLTVDTRVLLCALGLSVFCTLLGHSIFSWGLKYLQASYISNAKMLCPVFAAVIGLLLFGEKPPITSVLGCIVVIGGVMLYSNSLSKESNE